MTAAGAHVRASVLELARYPSFSLSALLFPAVLFLVLVRAYTQPANARLAGFAGVAILGVVFFQFGVGIAADRVSAWELFLRTLPASPRLRIVARVCSALLFASLAAGVVVAVAVATTPVRLAAARWPLLALVLALGAIPFGLLGIAIGYLVRPRAALPIANMLYLPLSYAGGLWAGPRHGSTHLLDLVPTHAWGVLLWASVGEAPFDALAVAALGAWTCALGLLAASAYRRDEGERFT